MSIFNKKLKIDSLHLLQQIEDNCVSACFLDPQYRGGLETINYGNEGMRQVERSKLPQMSSDYIHKLIGEIERVLKPSGHLFLWADAFSIASGESSFMCSNRLDGKKCSLNIVDIMFWHKQKFGMGYRSRRTGEYMLISQKSPKRVKGVWEDHSIPDMWSEKSPQDLHVHQKPAELLRKLILSVTKENDIVLDPCAGSFLTYKICKKTNRNFIGTDIVFGDTSVT